MTLSGISISVIIPVYREEAVINRALERLPSQRPERATEIIVIDGDASGSTIRAIGRQGVITAIAPKGRGSQMNRGAALATGDVLLFLHADTVLPCDAFGLIDHALHHDGCTAGAFDLGIDSDRWIFRVTERYVALRSRLTRIPFGDQAIFIRRPSFEKIGGYREIPIMEDVELMARIRKDGQRICILQRKVMTSPRRWEREGILYCTFRNWALQAGYTIGIPPERLARWYR